MNRIPAALALLALGALLFSPNSAQSTPSGSPSPTVTPIPNTGWRLWLDDQAPWQNDTLYLPSQVHLAAMPVNPPTGGWAVLSPPHGIPVSLPGTVEEHYWGQAPARVLDPSNPENLVDGDGTYKGVSWWYRTFTPPALKPGEHLVFTFPGARLRAEVYVNGRLVGYDVVTETQFDADVTAAIKPNQPNTLAVRITNPGGNLSWGDFNLMQWGKYQIPLSHGFGGLDGGVTMAVRGPVSVTDLAMLNTSDPKTVTFTAQLTSTGRPYSGPLALSIHRDGKLIWSGAAAAQIEANGTTTVTKTVTVPTAQLWDIGKPNLYIASAAIPSIPHSDKQTTFGFRWFTAKGVGTDAILTLNGRRIVVKSAISWGFWSPNGMFPDKAAAQRDVASVKALGLNCIQNHRHMPKPIVFDAYDRAGIMRYSEAGAGCFTYVDPKGTVYPTSGPIPASGKGGEPTEFYNEYELDKVLAMIKAERSHPSAIIWSLQNEASINRYNPKIYYTLHKMREADPSRVILLESGFSTRDQVWALPYSDNLLYDKGQGSGWNDQHSAGQSKGVYQDSDYNSADDFLYNVTNKAEVSVFGEMATGASPDDHGAMAQWYKDNNAVGYDRVAHETVNAGYENFIDKYGFRAAFPTAESLFTAAADMHYYSAAKIMENARMCNLNDYIVLSGWESTVVDNHSGLVDALRNPKTNPAPIRAATEPDLLVVRAPHYVVAQGDPATVDVHLVNENVLHGPYTLSVKAYTVGDAKPIFTTSAPVNVVGGDQFAQLLKANIAFTPKDAGYVTVTATLTAPGGAAPTLTKSDRILVVNTDPAPMQSSVATIGSPQIGDAIKQQFGLSAAPYTASDGKLDTILVGAVSTGQPVGASETWHQGKASNNDIHKTPDPGLYTDQYFGPPGTLVTFENLANGRATVTLYFAETYFDEAGKRVFDVALNGQTVLRSFDIYQEAGGKGIGVNKTFTVDIADGRLAVSSPKVEADNANFTAAEVTDSQGHVHRMVFGKTSYKDSKGNIWNGVTSVGYDWSALPPDVLTRVHNDGTRLIFLSSDAAASDVENALDALAQKKILTFTDMVGNSDASWMGRWYFGKQNWLLNGLPSNCILDWQYQITIGNGMRIAAPGLDAVIGYGINHDPNPGLGAAIIPYGKGQIVLFCIPGLAQSFVDNKQEGIDPITAKRIVYNTLAGPS